MGKTRVTGKGLYVVLIFAVIVLLFAEGFAQAAEKATKKTTQKPAAVKQEVTKEKPQTGGILKIIEATGPKTPFGWPVEGVGEASVANKPVLESLFVSIMTAALNRGSRNRGKLLPTEAL
jgi:Na+/H+-dicarboxylate symporter